ncbi:ribonuclease HII [Candidatus Similichlamydia epinepheli]|uniref:ribonuclease HII n=1 Tax=Candidatus Similichlamydia epinepheli TaxID=1903953 RepID=UPI0019584490|nr:ribonuclease HII [Candidatus Similichlamydia epinepheli]
MDFPVHSGIEFDISSLRERADWIIGVDEVGRGCLAGPVLAAACRIRIGEARGLGVRDSKQLSAKKRELLVDELFALPSLKCSYGIATVKEIDSINIERASLLAMERALGGLDLNRACIFVDGKLLPSLERTAGYVALEAYVKGDSLSWIIGAASIFAKVKRDAIMSDLEKRYPGYLFDKNKGYGTAEHLLALKTIGVSPEHRLCFKPVREAFLFFSGMDM